MTKETYLERLEKLLEGMDPKEKEEALAYCREYFEDAQDKDVEQIIKELGTPEEFAEQLKSDESLDEKTAMTKDEKTSFVFCVNMP